MKTYEAGAILNAMYDVERNVRIQNVPGKGFYGCFPQGSISVNWGIDINQFNQADPKAATSLDGTSQERLLRFAIYYMLRN
jgi:hypothetical protein